MNTQEREQLSSFLQQLAQAQALQKDEEAQAMINSAVARQPDAAYLLVQRALILDGALKNAQAQITQLQAQLAQSKAAAPATSFLDANAWGRSPVASVATPQPSTPTMASAPALPAAAPMAAPASGFQAPSFLTSMATTAAGVAAGAFLFQGVSHLLGDHGNASTQSASALPPASHAGETTVTNNYFDSPAPGGSDESGSDVDVMADGADYSDDSASV